jgi:hypothetical protein
MNNIDDLKDTLKRLAFRDRGDSSNLVINLDDVFDELDELKSDLLQNIMCSCCKSNKAKICDKCNSDMCVSATGQN